MLAAQYQQRLIGQRRDGGNVLWSVRQELLYNEDDLWTANTVLAQVDFMPKLVAQLQDEPEEVIKAFEEIRDCCE